jgi:hypothetical protein
MGEGGMYFPHGGVRLGRGREVWVGVRVWGLGNWCGKGLGGAHLT